MKNSEKIIYEMEIQRLKNSPTKTKNSKNENHQSKDTIMKNDLAYISMVIALYNIAQDTKQDEGIIQVEEDAESARKIHYCMNRIKERLDKSLHKHSNEWEIITPIRQRLLKVVIENGSESVQPDYLATYMLRFRFVRTKREINDEFKWIGQKGSSLLHLLDMLDKTQVSDRDDEMCDLAYKLAHSLE